MGRGDEDYALHEREGFHERRPSDQVSGLVRDVQLLEGLPERVIIEFRPAADGNHLGEQAALTVADHNHPVELWVLPIRIQPLDSIPKCLPQERGEVPDRR